MFPKNKVKDKIKDLTTLFDSYKSQIYEDFDECSK